MVHIGGNPLSAHLGARVLCVLIFIALRISTSAAADNTKRPFDLAAGDAGRMLKVFAKQAHREIMFPAEALAGATTNQVKGNFTPREALDLLIAHTGLIVIEETNTGAFLVNSSQRAKPSAPRPPSETDPPNKPKQSMTPGTSKNPLVTLGRWMAVALAPLAQAADQPNPAEKKPEVVIELSAFEVRADSDTSYGALNSSSITRFNTELSTMPVSADIFTKAFMDDVAATSVESMIQNYSAGAGFAASDPGSAAATVQEGDRNGNAYIQLRGLSTPISQRDGFMPVGSFSNPGSTGVGVTSNFDVERVEVIRGPQALLYGGGGAGGVINITSKMARFGRRDGSALFRVNQYGMKVAQLDLNVGAKNLAVRAAFLNQDQQGRRLNIGGPINGQYIQFAARVLDTTTVRLSLEQTKFARINNTSSSIALPTTDPRNGFSLHYLLATNQAGATNPVTGAAYSGGALFNGHLDWDNTDSLAGRMSSELVVNDYVQLTADTKWTKWLSTQFAVGYNDYHDQRVTAGVTLRGPGASGNTLTSWSGASTPADTIQPARSKGIRFSALATNELFRGRAHSQTIVGADFWRTMLSQIDYKWYQADANFNAIVNPAVTTNNGRTLMTGQFFSLADGVVLKPLFYPGAQQATINGVNFVRQLANPPNPALRSPENPHGVTLAGGAYVISKIINQGIFGANTTSWLDRRLDTLVGFRFAHSDYDRLDQGNAPTQPAVTRKRAIAETANFNAGANYALLSWLRPYVGVSDSYQPPPVVAISPVGEVPRTAHGLGGEVGLKFTNASGTISGSLAFYGTKSTNEEIQINSTLQNDINPTGLNGRSGASGVWVNVDRKSRGLELMLTAAPTKNWRTRFSAATVDGTIGSTRIYKQLYNDQFFAKGDAVTYADGTAVWVPTTPSAATPTRPAGTAGAIPLTIAMMNDRTSPYWANPQAITGAITASSAVATVLKSTDAAHGTILTGATGLPISALQIAPDPANAPPGEIPVSLAGEKTVGYPLYSASFTNIYTFSSERLHGLKIGGTARLGWQYRNYYYYPNGIVPGVSRALFSYPTQVQFDLITGYTRKLGRFTFSTQLNVANIFNRYHVLILPNSTSGYRTPSGLNATFDNQPRVFTWTNEIKF